MYLSSLVFLDYGLESLELESLLPIGSIECYGVWFTLSREGVELGVIYTSVIAKFIFIHNLEVSKSLLFTERMKSKGIFLELDPFDSLRKFEHFINNLLNLIIFCLK